MSWVWRSSSRSSRTVTRSAGVSGGWRGAAKKRSMDSRGAVEDDVDVGVAGGPEVFEQGFGELLRRAERWRRGGVEGFAQGGAPLLVPAGLAAVAAAVGAPALDAVGAAPGGVFGDFGLPLRREFFEELAVVGEAWRGRCPRSSAWRRRAPSRRACGGGRSFRRRWRRGRAGRVGVRRSGRKAGEQAAGEGFAAVEQALEGDGAGGGAVVEEDGDGAAFVELDQVGVGGVDGGVGGFGPGFGRAGRSGKPGIGWRCGGAGRGAADAGALVGARMVNLMPSAPSGRGRCG
jgi:hypothetical protein